MIVGERREASTVSNCAAFPAMRTILGLMSEIPAFEAVIEVVLAGCEPLRASEVGISGAMNQVRDGRIRAMALSRADEKASSRPPPAGSRENQPIAFARQTNGPVRKTSGPRDPRHEGPEHARDLRVSQDVFFMRRC